MGGRGDLILHDKVCVLKIKAGEVSWGQIINNFILQVVSFMHFVVSQSKFKNLRARVTQVKLLLLYYIISTYIFIPKTFLHMKLIFFIF